MATNFLKQLYNLDVEDLQYIERDLSYYQLVSLGFLLFAYTKVNAEFILQKLIVLSKQPPSGNGVVIPNGEIFLREYCKLNPTNWKHTLVEALAIINARKILRKMGFAWQDIRDFYLPHINELALHIHPVLKALYKICENLTPEDVGKMVSYVNSSTSMKYQRDQLVFNDFMYLEIYLLEWITRSIITIGDSHCQGTDIDCLIQYFKLNDMDNMKYLLHNTIQQNIIDDNENDSEKQMEQKDNADISVDFSNDKPVEHLCKDTPHSKNLPNLYRSLKYNYNENDERYRIRKEMAGFVLIINQYNFYEESDPTLKHLLPKMKFKKTREGSNVDRDRLSHLFGTFGYTPLIYNNLTHLEMLHCIRETVKKSILKDSIIVCVLTHGAKDVVYGCNSVPVKISDIQEILAHDNLHHKPKMLIIQACQKEMSPLEENNYSNLSDSVSLAYADMLIALSSIPGTEAMRDTLKGSWYIESMCDVIERKGDVKHVIDMLTSVANIVTNKNHKEFMLPTFRSTLRKEFYLPARDHNSI